MLKKSENLTKSYYMAQLNLTKNLSFSKLSQIIQFLYSAFECMHMNKILHNQKPNSAAGSMWLASHIIGSQFQSIILYYISALQEHQFS